MRYLVSGILGLAALWLVNSVVDIGGLERPYPSLIIASTLLVVFFVTLVIWEQLSPSEDTSVQEEHVREVETREQHTEHKAGQPENDPENRDD